MVEGCTPRISRQPFLYQDLCPAAPIRRRERSQGAGPQIAAKVRAAPTRNVAQSSRSSAEAVRTGRRPERSADHLPGCAVLNPSPGSRSCSEGLSIGSKRGSRSGFVVLVQNRLCSTRKAEFVADRQEAQERSWSIWDSIVGEFPRFVAAFGCRTLETAPERGGKACT
jgi:hypothetical protein